MSIASSCLLIQRHVHPRATEDPRRELIAILSLAVAASASASAVSLLLLLLLFVRQLQLHWAVSQAFCRNWQKATPLCGGPTVFALHWLTVTAAATGNPQYQ